MFPDYLFCLLTIISCLRVILCSADLESSPLPTLVINKVITRLFTQSDGRFGFTKGMHCASSVINGLCWSKVMKMFRCHTVDVDYISNQEIFYKNQ